MKSDFQRAIFFAEANECGRSLCMAIRQRFRLQAEQRRTMELQLTKEEKNNNQTKKKVLY